MRCSGDSGKPDSLIFVFKILMIRNEFALAEKLLKGHDRGSGQPIGTEFECDINRTFGICRLKRLCSSQRHAVCIQNRLTR